jgi:integrase
LIDIAGQEWGITVAANPCAMVKRPAEPRGRDRRLQEGEEARLLESAATTSALFVGIIKFELETGARLGELLNLQWSDVNQTRRTALLRETKNGDSRTIPLSTSAISALNALPRNISDKRVFYSWKASDSFSKTWVRCCTRAKIADLKFHDLRHEAVSRLFEKGLNVMEVASISGHKTLAMLKRYTHLKAEDLARKLG